jgi:hypothetical protein
VSDPLLVPAFGRTGLTPAAVLRLTADCPKIRGTTKSPRACAMPKLTASLLATGRGWAHSPSHVAATGAWKESGMARGPGGPTATVAVEAPAMGWSAATAPQGHMAGKVRKRKPAGCRFAAGRKSPHAGAARRPRGPLAGPRRLRKEPRGRPGRVCRGRRKPAPGLPRGTRVPVAPSRTPPGAARNGRRVRRRGQTPRAYADCNPQRRRRGV